MRQELAEAEETLSDPERAALTKIRAAIGDLTAGSGSHLLVIALVNICLGLNEEPTEDARRNYIETVRTGLARFLGLGVSRTPLN